MATAAPSRPAQTSEILQLLKRLEQERVALVAKIGELNQELREHDLVLEAFSNVEGSRPCYRSVGGILVERNVGNVTPAVKENKENIEEAIKKLSAELNEKSGQHEALKAKIQKVQL